MKKWGTVIFPVLLTATSLVASVSQGYAQANNKPASIQVMETSIDAIQAAYKTGRLTAHQLVQDYLDRISAYDKQGPKINAIISLNPKALEDADRLDAAYKKSGLTGPMHGIPILVKDEIDVAGLPTTLGTVVFKDYKPTRDSFVVEQLRKAGAIILGKTTLSEYAAGDTFGSMFGVTRNPYDLERTVGGSSGGSADEESAASHVGSGPDQVADALESEHRVINEEGNRVDAVVRISGARRYKRTH